MTITELPHTRRNTSAESPEQLSRDAGTLLNACGIEKSRAWISRVIRDFASAQIEVPFGLFLVARLDLNAVERHRLAERADLRYLLTYSDPTGETAGRHLARERGEEW